MSANGNGSTNGHVAPAPPVAEAAASSAAPSKIQPNDVGWQFVPQYYNFVNKHPHRLHCFYGKQSTFVHGEEGEEIEPAHGQQAINAKISAIGYVDCKVYIHSIDSQASAGGGIIVLVIGEMSNNGGSWRKFTQTFFLAEQPNGYFVLNDIFRYLREEDSEEEDGEGETVQEIPVVPVDVHVDAPIESIPADSYTTPQPKHAQIEASAPEPTTAAEPEPVSAPSAPVTEEVPAEAVAAAVPDKDISPSEPPAVEEPAAVAAAPEEPTKAASPAPAPKADLPNGSAAQQASAPTPAPAPAPAATPAAPPAQPAAPAKPAAPRSWAAMAAGNAASKPAAAAPAPTPAPAAAAPTPAAAPKKEEAPAASSSGRSQAYDNAMKIQTQHCFVKLPNWSLDNQSGGDVVDENTIKATAARFGDVNKVEIVKAKACAFVEFAKVDSARRAIATSLPQSQGGEGGVKISGQQGRLNFVGRLEKDERKPKGPGGPGQGPAQGQQGQGQQGQGAKGPRTDQRGGARGGGGVQRGGGGRGRGGPGGQGGDRPAPAQKA